MEGEICNSSSHIYNLAVQRKMSMEESGYGVGRKFLIYRRELKSGMITSPTSREKSQKQVFALQEYFYNTP